MRNLCVDEGDFIQIDNVSLSVATYAKFQPQSVDFLDITNPKAVYPFFILEIRIIIICQICCRHWLSWPSNPLCCQFSWWAHFLEILFLLQSYSDCLCILCLSLLLVPQVFPLNICFSSPSALFICPIIGSCLFLMFLSRDLLYLPISITSAFDFFFSPWYSHYSSDVPHFCCFKSSF